MTAVGIVLVASLAAVAFLWAAHTISYTLTRGGQTNVQGNYTETNAAEWGYDNQIAASTTDWQIDVNLAIAKIKSIVVVADQNMTIKTNSSSTPAQTWNLIANVPLIWDANSVAASPVTVNITALFFTTGANATNLKIYVVLAQ